MHFFNEIILYTDMLIIFSEPHTGIHDLSSFLGENEVNI